MHKSCKLQATAALRFVNFVCCVFCVLCLCFFAFHVSRSTLHASHFAFRISISIPISISISARSHVVQRIQIALTALTRAGRACACSACPVEGTASMASLVHQPVARSVSSCAQCSVLVHNLLQHIIVHQELVLQLQKRICLVEGLRERLRLPLQRFCTKTVQILFQAALLIRMKLENNAQASCG